MRRFVWLLGALVMAVGALLYMQSRVPLVSVAPTPAGDLARPAADRQALVSGLFQGALTHAVDGEDFIETPSYRRVLYHVRSTPAEEFSARVSGRLDWKAAVEEPDRWRGEFVRVRGLVADIRAVRLQGLDAGIEDVYRGMIAQHDGSDAVIFDYIDYPPELALHKDVIDVEGVFYRTVRYESRDGTEREAPYLIARSLTLAQPPGPPPSPWILGLKIAAVVVGSVLVGLLFVRWTPGQRKRRGDLGAGQAGIRQMLEARLREDRERGPGPGPQER